MKKVKVKEISKALDKKLISTKVNAYLSRESNIK